MVRVRRAFTLSELLVVIAIISIVAVITFPVMSGAIASAKKVACTSNFHQTQIATQLYLTDYDDHFMLVNHRVNPQPGEVDKTWVQLLLPYLQEFDIFRCPADSRHRERVDATFDIDLVPGDTYDRYYRASLLSNIGYNYLYLSPIVKLTNNGWTVQPRTTSEVGDANSMLLFVDTISPRTTKDFPMGGGSYIVIPPCRTTVSGEDTFGLNHNPNVFAPRKGWYLIDGSPERFGRAWPWHQGRATVAQINGSVKSMTMEQLASGCDVRENWGGTVRDLGNYAWDTK
jgi:prepilin-type N-terminal cleavage/methylation domain-containing protein